MNEQQLTLPLEGFTVIQGDSSREASIQERFEEFHRSNPQVYEAYRSVALQLVRSGVKHRGISALTEILRYDDAIQTHGAPFKICNSYRSRYARLLMKNEPALRGFFELRSLRERNCEVQL